MTKLDLRQISAGIALAGLTQAELATLAGLEAASLSRILKGEVQPRPETLDRIQIALESKQVEFGPRSSVALKDDYFRRLQGPDVFVRLLDEILRVMIGRTDDVLFFMVDPSVSTPAVKNALERLYDAGITCRYICSENNNVFDAPIEFYRAMPEKYFTNEVQVVYGDYVAINSLTPQHNVIILNSPSAAAAERGKFDFIWNNCKQPLG